jgi:hypothetical protein
LTFHNAFFDGIIEHYYQWIYDNLYYPAPPVNLFTLLDLPLTAPVSAIRVALLEKQKSNFAVGFQNKIREDVETLLSRLSSFEARVVYVKYVVRRSPPIATQMWRVSFYSCITLLTFP